ncbi:uncharacterized protein si:ch211-14c7.2 [Anabas testudineus]|uniref:uncharacterized protein si:ch211-14c7.2 n=1 Tax=Anabas testudineus TaxID=64144 RepID=UPI000E461C42|nr:uncharacterized protein si:ch211-14c7.2 [Anabas testudineus]
MRPTTSIMLQQNNNNNYPCLNVSGSTREMLQKCSRAALPFPGRLELGDLPLIRGLRAWALCSKNRRKAGGLLGGGQSPTAPLAGRGNVTSCSKPADVYLSGEWGRMGYGLPLGLDARQAEIGALVTVATLKTSEGSGRTQTQCLFLQTEKGSCLYSTAKPVSGVTSSAGSSVVGGWLRGKTGGGGGRDAPTGRRAGGPTSLTQTGANRVRVGSGRRWRKSGNAAGREKPVVSRERQQRSRVDPAGEVTLETMKEVQDKGALHSKQFPSSQQDSKKARQEKEGVCRTPRCCHNAFPKPCTQCRRRAQRRESQEEQEGGESPSSEEKEIRKEKDEEEGGVSELGSSNLVLAAPNPDLESNSSHPEFPSGCVDEEFREAECNEELKMQNSPGKDDVSKKKQDTNFDMMKIQTANHDFIHVPSGKLTEDLRSRQDRPAEDPCEDVVAGVIGFSDHVEAKEEPEIEKETVDVEEEERSFTQTPTDSTVVSKCCDSVSVSNCSASINNAFFPESSAPLEGSICTAEHEACYVQQEQAHSQGEHLRYEKREEDDGLTGKEELDVSTCEAYEVNAVADENNTVKFNNTGKSEVFFKNEENKSSCSALRHKDPSVAETDENRGDCQTTEYVVGNKLNGENGDDAEEIWKTEHVLNDKGDNDKEQHTEDQSTASAIQQDNYEVEGNCAIKDKWRLQESADGSRKQKKEDGDTSITHVEENRKTNTNVAWADSSTSPALALANPAPSLPPLGSMATGLPSGEGGQEGRRRHGRELEEQGEGERGSTVATEEGRKEEEEDEFGVFMQAEGAPAWSEGVAMSASVPCGSRESVAALGSHAIPGESTHWTPGWMDNSFPQSDDTWTAFPQDSSGGGQDAVGEWWPTGAVEQRRDGLSASQNVVSVFAEAFPSPPGSSAGGPCDLDTVPTLTQLLRGRASQDQGCRLLDSFHDLNKMIGQRYKRASGVSHHLLLKTLHLEQPQTESRPALWTANRRLSPGLPSANQHAQNAAAKRRLSYDYNRNIME